MSSSPAASSPASAAPRSGCRSRRRRPPPFTAGSFLFGHNGFVPDAAALRGLLPPAPCRSRGSTAPCVWTLVQARLSAGAGLDEALADVVDTIAAGDRGRLNLFLTDGRRLAATTWGDTLWYRTGADGVLVASEPDDEATERAESAWRELPDRTLLTVEQAEAPPLSTARPLAPRHRTRRPGNLLP